MAAKWLLLVPVFWERVPPRLGTFPGRVLIVRGARMSFGSAPPKKKETRSGTGQKDAAGQMSRGYDAEEAQEAEDKGGCEAESGK